ncbi:hypothetical protein J2S78_002051 [Salibacterium salarium]|uniref:hypothetical protein n=1 Tax=Salibacterium salarium TaxID=284579 RepID=UPI00277E5BA2|nr:hypothetical protein [Salibacterium salarium]MDQ0299631.1 hypothetical protein [Salibacterium salarium]
MIHTNMICKVERYDTETGIGDIVPLFTDEDGEQLPMIVNARAQRQRLKLPKERTLESGNVEHSPIPDGGTSHTIDSGSETVSYDPDGDTQDVLLIPSYKKGDIVMACITERDFADAIKGRKGNGDSREPHDSMSAIITGLVGDEG